MEKVIMVSGNKTIPFYNNVDYCIGTGRMDWRCTGSIWSSCSLYSKR